MSKQYKVIGAVSPSSEAFVSACVSERERETTHTELRSYAKHRHTPQNKHMYGQVALAFLPPLVVLQIVFNGFNIAIENTPRLLWPMPRCTRVCLCLSCVYPVCMLLPSLPQPPLHTHPLSHTRTRAGYLWCAGGSRDWQSMK